MKSSSTHCLQHSQNRKFLGRLPLMTVQKGSGQQLPIVGTLCLHKMPVLKESCKMSKSACILCLQHSGRHRNGSCTFKWVTSSLVRTACNCLLPITCNQAAMRSGPDE